MQHVFTLSSGGVVRRLRRCLVQAAVVWGLLVCSLSPVHAQSGRWYPEDGAAPALKLKAISGEEVDLASFKGRMVIVNFWATWCGPCVAEMPSLQALAATLGEKNAVLLGVNFHESPQKIRDFQAKYQVKFPLLRDTGKEASGAWKVGVLPTTFIVDANGTLRWRVVGEVDWSSKQVADRLKLIAPAQPRQSTARRTDPVASAVVAVVAVVAAR